jgi:hypothetical protein
MKNHFFMQQSENEEERPDLGSKTVGKNTEPA